MEKNEIYVPHSKKNMASYGTGVMGREFVQMAFNMFVFFYYESEIGLNVWLIGLGLIIFAIYNALNDPLVGYLTNRPFGFTKKWGRRLPWILIGGIPLGISYVLVYTPPDVDPQSGAWILFGWLVITTCLFDTFHSLFFVNLQSVFPDKFRGLDERRTATGIQIIFGVVGVTLGAILPPLLITFGDLSSYIFQGVIVMIITIIAILVGIPGFREDQETIDAYLSISDKQIERTQFFQAVKMAFKQKSFIAYMILYTLYWTVVISVEASLPYIVRYTLKMPASATTLIMAGFLLGAILAVPIWVTLAKKLNNNGKVMLITSIAMAISLIPMLFAEGHIFFIVCGFLFGLAQGGFWAMIFPVFSDIIDESVVLYEKREEGTYIGIQQFFGRLALIIQVMSFAIVHTLTGFVEGSETQSAQAIWGITVHLAVVPIVCIIIGAIIFWRLFDLTPDKVNEHQRLIKEIKL